MPRGGSKKGEHRGNARSKDSRTNAVMRSTVRQADKPKAKKGVGPKERPKTSTVEVELLAARVIDGPPRRALDMTPKEIMLDNMHFFQQAAYDYAVMALVAARDMPDGEEKRRTVSFAEQEVERNRRLASDEARNVIPYLSARLAAVKIIDDPGAGVDIVQRMLDEVDQRNRDHPMVIEHMPAKRTA